MLSINQLMKYLRNHHQISVKSNQAQSLRNIANQKILMSFSINPLQPISPTLPEVNSTTSNMQSG